MVSSAGRSWSHVSCLMSHIMSNVDAKTKEGHIRKWRSARACQTGSAGFWDTIQRATRKQWAAFVCKFKIWALCKPFLTPCDDGACLGVCDSVARCFLSSKTDWVYRVWIKSRCIQFTYNTNVLKDACVASFTCQVRIIETWRFWWQQNTSGDSHLKIGLCLLMAHFPTLVVTLSALTGKKKWVWSCSKYGAL